MDITILAEYGWSLLLLVALEGLLSADNALVLAVMVKPLPKLLQRRALFYGLAGAFVFRFISLFIISILVHVWQVQAIGALYLMGLGAKHIIKNHKNRADEAAVACTTDPQDEAEVRFWPTVLKIELTDIAFAVDSILAAVAIAVSLPRTTLPAIGGMDGGHFLIVLTGGLMGLILMRFAAGIFVDLLHRRPRLEMAAYGMISWIGVKLAMHTLTHPAIALLPHDLTHTLAGKAVFWTVLLSIFAVGMLSGKPETKATHGG